MSSDQRSIQGIKFSIQASNWSTKPNADQPQARAPLNQIRKKRFVAVEESVEVEDTARTSEKKEQWRG